MVNEELVAPVVVSSGVPPVEFGYHRKIPLTPVEALKETVPGLQEIPFVPVMALDVPFVAVTAIRGLVHAGDVVVIVT